MDVQEQVSQTDSEVQPSSVVMRMSLKQYS